MEQRKLLLTLLAIRENGLRVDWKVTRRHAMALVGLRPDGEQLDRPVSRSWCKKFNRSNGFRRRRATKAARKVLGDDADAIEERFLLQVAFLVKEHQIPKVRSVFQHFKKRPCSHKNIFFRVLFSTGMRLVSSSSI
jgi:hypothetical protein